jgi:hypothetical protein
MVSEVLDHGGLAPLLVGYGMAEACIMVEGCGRRNLIVSW